MAAAKFDVIFRKDSRYCMVQCKSCGSKSDLLSDAAVILWAEDHACGKKPVKVSEIIGNEKPTPKLIETAPEPQPDADDTLDVDETPPGGGVIEEE